MLNAIIRFSLRYRMVILFLSLTALVYGGYVTTNLPIDVFPDLDRPRVVVMTECPGLAPEEVEALVTFPLEAALLGATGVQAVRSQSGVALSVIYVEFDWDTNVYLARQTVQERLATVTETLPPGLRPQMAPISSIMGQIMHVGLHWRLGPHGGQLAELPAEGIVAELEYDGAQGRVTLHLYARSPREALTAWQPLARHVEAARLAWAPPAAGRNASPGQAAATGTSPEDGKDPLTLQLTPAGEQGFTATSPLLTSAKDGVSFQDLRRRVTLAIGGREVDFDFPSQLQRQLSLRTLADWVVRPRLLRIAGIAQVVVMGGDRKQYQVLVDPQALLNYDVSLKEVEEALRNNNLNTSGGFAIRGVDERPIRILGRLGPKTDDVLAQIRLIPVKTSGERPILVNQVARVVEGPQLKRGDASVDGFPAVVLTIAKQPHQDTRRLTDEIKAALNELGGSLPIDVTINTELFQFKRFIDSGIYNVAEALAIGAGLVIVVLFLFLLNLRTTFISLTAIPLSLVVTAITFKLTGWFTGTPLTINVMTLGGIAVALGELVDDSIVDVENIFRRLRLNSHLAQPRPVLEVIYEASVEIRSAIVFGTMLVILVFIPLFALSGIEGRLFAPLGVAYVTSILASLLVSLTVTPVLSYYLLPQARATHRQLDSPLLRVLKWLAKYVIRASMRFAGTILIVSWLLVGLSAWLLTQIGADFLPPFDEGSVQVNVSLPPGSSLEASNQAAAVVDRVFRRRQHSAANPDGEILHFVRRTGRAELDEHAEPVGNSEYVLSMRPDAGQGRDAVVASLLADLKSELPGVDVEVEQPLAHLISHMLSGVTAQIAIKVFGDDLDQLQRSANEIKSAISGIRGLTPPVIEAQRRIEEFHLRLRPERLAFHGIDRAYVAEFVSAALLGEELGQVLEGQRRFDLLVRLDEPYRSDLANLGRLRVTLPGGRGQVPLGELAEIGEGIGANAVNRENARRRIVIRCNAQGRDLASVVAEVRQRVYEEVQLPEGYFVEYGGLFESQRRATILISVLAAVAIVGMFVLLYVLYPSTRVVLQILNALPTAFTGGVLALVLTGQSLTVASMVGFISLAGIAARNGILLVSHYFHLMRHEGEGFTKAMVLRGSLERLSPVLMTALTTGIGLVPLVVAGQQPGREILYPVATVILGGLMTSTLCEYLIHPGIFWRFSGHDAERLALREDGESSPANAAAPPG